MIWPKVLNCSAWRWHAGLAPRLGDPQRRKDKAARRRYLPRRAGPRVVMPEPQAVRLPEGGLGSEEEDVQFPSLEHCLLGVTKVMGLTLSL